MICSSSWHSVVGCRPNAAFSPPLSWSVCARVAEKLSKTCVFNIQTSLPVWVFDFLQTLSRWMLRLKQLQQKLFTFEQVWRSPFVSQHSSTNRDLKVVVNLVTLFQTLFRRFSREGSEERSGHGCSSKIEPWSKINVSPWHKEVKELNNTPLGAGPGLPSLTTPGWQLPLTCRCL